MPWISKKKMTELETQWTRRGRHEEAKTNAPVERILGKLEMLYAMRTLLPVQMERLETARVRIETTPGVPSYLQDFSVAKIERLAEIKKAEEEREQAIAALREAEEG